MKHALDLQVAEARPEDTGRCLARLAKGACDALGVATGDLVFIRGRRTTVAKVARGAPDHPGACVRIDGLTRQNAQAGLGETVALTPATAVQAEVVEYIGNGLESPGHPALPREFLDLPLVPGDALRHVSFGRTLREIRIVRAQPDGPVVVGPETVFKPGHGQSDTGLDPRLTYEDIGGLDRELERIRELVELPMRHPELFERLGIQPSRGILLIGPPGTGKTLIARTIASEVQASFFAVNGPEFISKYYGESESRLRQVFTDARNKAPSIIFLDELDAIAPCRQNLHGDLEKRVVAQLLTLLDGLKDRGQVMVVAATNLPDQVDPALRRPGRLDREVWIGLPDEHARRQIMAIHTRQMPLDGVDLDRLAALTPGYAGADLAFLCREAAMAALRRVLPAEARQGRIMDIKPEKLTVQAGDFAMALREIVPAMTRQVAVERPSTTWDDVGGQEPAKELRQAIEWPLRFKREFADLGLRPPRGILLTGPPGVGKTMLARAASNAAGVSFIMVKGAELLSHWLGDSERGVGEIFRKARHSAPSVLFFDEIDALARHRGTSAAEAVDRVVGQLLVEMDGLSDYAGVVVLGATNRLDLLDAALLRPGRFEIILALTLPDARARAEILRLHLSKRALAADLDLETLAAATDGWSGAELAALCRRAGYRALDRHTRGQSHGSPAISQDDLMEAVARVREISERSEAHARK